VQDAGKQDDSAPAVNEEVKAEEVKAEAGSSRQVAKESWAEAACMPLQTPPESAMCGAKTEYGITVTQWRS
jgi:hypothetical protein